MYRNIVAKKGSSVYYLNTPFDCWYTALPLPPQEFSQRTFINDSYSTTIQY